MSGYEPDDLMLRIARKATQRESTYGLIFGIGLLVLLAVVVFVVSGS